MGIDWETVAIGVFWVFVLGIAGAELYRAYLGAKLARMVELMRARNAATEACTQAEGSWFNFRNYMSDTDRREYDANHKDEGDLNDDVSLKNWRGLRDAHGATMATLVIALRAWQKIWNARNDNA